MLKWRIIINPEESMCELTDTLSISYRYKIASQKDTVLPLSIENAEVPIQLVNEGDLDGNGTDEIGFHYQNGAGCWGMLFLLIRAAGKLYVSHIYTLFGLT